MEIPTRYGERIATKPALTPRRPFFGRQKVNAAEAAGIPIIQGALSAVHDDRHMHVGAKMLRLRVEEKQSGHAEFRDQVTSFSWLGAGQNQAFPRAVDVEDNGVSIPGSRRETGPNYIFPAEPDSCNGFPEGSRIKLLPNDLRFRQFRHDSELQRQHVCR